MGQRTLVPDAGEVVLYELRVIGRDRLVMVLRSAGERSCCPVCLQTSRRVHSRYSRHLSDLPWEGIPVRIELHVRRFFCGTSECGQHIFTERLPNTVQRYGRRTCRLSGALKQITLVLGGSAGSRLAEQLGILASGSTLLRELQKRAGSLASSAPRVVGIDDWAWRKGQRYGTIVCDLERRKVIDLLPDRSAESTAAWLRAHPGIEIVSRDRASLYAEAAHRAVPHAIQIADRWHLLRNLSEALTGVLAPHHRIMAETARVVSERTGILPIERSSAATIPTRAERVKQGRRDRRVSRYESVIEQVRTGLSQAEISRRLGIDRRTIRRWTRSGDFPERKPVFRRSSIDEYRRYLDQRWEEGCHNASQLWREMRERGFTGMDSIVRNWIRQHHGCRISRLDREPTVPQMPRVSPRQTTWQILKPCESGRPYLEELYRRCPEIATAAGVAREFFRIVQQRDLPAWANWQESARHSALASFARHLYRDEAAVQAALQYRWNNGPVEGNVHRLKLIKRSMYGRASFDLLRLRVLATV
ncbi:MAG TPA: ISL3 family transposase [Edaphobacter sp.]